MILLDHLSMISYHDQTTEIEIIAELDSGETLALMHRQYGRFRNHYLKFNYSTLYLGYDGKLSRKSADPQSILKFRMNFEVLLSLGGDH